MRVRLSGRVRASFGAGIRTRDRVSTAKFIDLLNAQHKSQNAPNTCMYMP